MTRHLPTAEQVAAIIMAAARECGENPMDIVDGKAGSRARIYAYVALRERCLHLTIKNAGRLCFAPNIDGLKAYAVQATRQDWWDPALLTRVSTCWPAQKERTVIAVEKAIDRAIEKPVAPRSRAPVTGPVSLPTPRDDRDRTNRARQVEVIRPQKSFPVMNPNPLVRRPPPARSDVSITAEMAGDPAPGRSALAQGYSPGSGLMQVRR